MVDELLANTEKAYWKEDETKRWKYFYVPVKFKKNN